VSGAPNPARGEAAIRVNGSTITLRPSFAALVAAEAELGSLIALVSRAAEQRLTLGEMVALFWHCRHGAPDTLTREVLGEAVVAQGIAAVTPALTMVLRQILAGRPGG
jgi:hypothetical protein